MKLQSTVLVLVACLLGCGAEEKKGRSDDCKRAEDAAHRTWGMYVKAVDNAQPKIAKKAAKFAPEKADADLVAASEAAIEAWKKATLEAKEAANKARFGKPGSDRLEPGQAALAAARAAHAAAGVAIDAAFAARSKKGADAIKRDKDAAIPEKGKRLSAKLRKELEAKSAATQARVAKNNGKVDAAKHNLTIKVNALLEFAKRAVETDAAAVAACAE